MASQPLPPDGILGANYNESLRLLDGDHDELRAVGAKWIRGFLDMHQMDVPHPEQRPNIKAVFGAIDAGFKMIISLKWDYQERDFPEPGSAEHVAELQVLERILALVMPRVDMMVIGNEPWIEAKPGQQNERLNVFYESMADAVIDFRERNHLPTRLYMGALNRLDLPAKRTPAIERFLRYIASKPQLDGVDVHLHIPRLPAHRTMLDYVLPRLRPDQTFIATEFSLIWHWKAHLGDAASNYFCSKYGFPAGTKVHEVINAAFENPFPYKQWEDFLANEPWYIQRRHFITNAMKMYRETGRMTIATYCWSPARKRTKPLLATDNPWFMSAVYCTSPVQLKEDGTRHENFPWWEEFRRAAIIPSHA
ncbi:uncharacterized protein PFLUO_LOCUS6373 [Penicillium psychrofluorescens]|uniref:uncharacterized protein n=1 Tax=Penicillium psychrofluorescens TaxID=3158075 RepID=UPI003CCCBA21